MPIYILQVTYAAGSDYNTFLSYIDVKANEVLDAADNSQRAQYVSVSFALNGEFTANTGTGLIPKTSIMVGAGSSSAEVSWVSSCVESISTQFLALIAQPCGPSLSMCLASNISDRSSAACP